MSAVLESSDEKYTVENIARKEAQGVMNEENSRRRRAARKNL